MAERIKHFVKAPCPLGRIRAGDIFGIEVEEGETVEWITDETGNAQGYKLHSSKAETPKVHAPKTKETKAKDFDPAD